MHGQTNQHVRLQKWSGSFLLEVDPFVHSLFYKQRVDGAKTVLPSVSSIHLADHCISSHGQEGVKTRSNPTVKLKSIWHFEPPERQLLQALV